MTTLSWRAVVGAPSMVLIRMRRLRLLRATGLVLAPLLLACSALVAYAHSATDLRVESMVWPLSLFLPSIWTPSNVGAGCWALVAANALLLVLWGGAIARRKPMNG